MAYDFLKSSITIVMFIASKLLSFATQPLAWVFLFLLAGLWGLSIHRKWGVRMVWAAFGLLLVQGWEPLPDLFIRQLENQYSGPPAESSVRQYAGVVVLGGALEPANIWVDHKQVALNDAAERMTASVTLLQQNPHLRLLFTGGEGELFVQGLTEAERARIFYDSMGIAPQRLLYESASHTTYENAIFSATLPGVNPARPWLLLTSASHMPRAMSTFVKAGWNVTAYPVDFRTGARTAWSRYSLADGARKWQMVLHEWVGLLAYRFAGRA